MKVQAWRDLAYLLEHGQAAEWAAAIDAIRVARGTAYLAQALDPNWQPGSKARIWRFVGISPIPRIL